MPVLFILFLEIVMFGYFSDRFGFLNTLATYWIPTFLLISLVPFLLSAVRSMTQQNIDMSGAYLSKQMNRVLVITGLFALIIPLISARILGLFLILPGFRHLLMWKFKSTVQNKTQQYFSKVGNGFHFYYAKRNSEFGDPIGNATRAFDTEPVMKDVTPITPESLQAPRKSDSSDT